MAHDPAKVGSYVLGPELGRGASGIVYEATDERLGRKVALKVLADDVARTAEQRARFAREARLLAAVQHPNVATVYGVVEQGERVWLALEYLPGETLADALAGGPLPIEDALDVARQIADGLEAAHEAGVVHRDLKPANVQRAADGTVKVLDFGLAKPVREGMAESTDLSSDGLILGTPLYMSPEQLRGRAVDRRADVWAFGCVLWELLTGLRAFEGETTADVLHAILERDPDPARLPERTPARVRELLSRCLRKDPRKRLRDVGDARLELEASLAERAWARGEPAASPVGRSGAVVGLAALALVAALAGAWWLGLRPSAAAPPRPLRIALRVPPGDKHTDPRLSPDGATLVHELASLDGRPAGRRLAARRLDAFEDVPIPGSERVDAFAFAPDGERLAVVRVSEASSARLELVVVRLDGSRPPRFLGVLPAAVSEGSAVWLDDGRIALATRPHGLHLVDADGSGRTSDVLVRCDESLWPYGPSLLGALPGGRRVLASSFQLGPRGGFPCVVAIDLESGEQTLLVEGARHALWQPSGRLLFSRADVLFAAPFDPETLALAGEPQPVASGLRTSSAYNSGAFHASREGTVAWEPGGVLGAERGIVSIDGLSEPEPWSDARLALDGFLNVDVDGDGAQAFLTAVVVGPSGNYELWGSEVAAPRLRQLVAETRYDAYGGTVSHARRELVYCRRGPDGGELRRTSLDEPGEGELCYAFAAGQLSSPRLLEDGRTLTLYADSPEQFGFLIFDLAAPPPLEPRIALDLPRSSLTVSVSPDGGWIAISDRDAPLVVRRIGADGSLGVPLPVPVPGVATPNARFVPSHEAGVLLLHIVARASPRVVEVAMHVGDGTPTFAAPRSVLELEGTRFEDLTRVEGDRYLAILTDADEDARDAVHVMIGGLPAPP